MALSYAAGTLAGGKPSAPTFIVPVTVTLDDSYASGGWALDFTGYIPAGAAVVGVVCPAVEVGTGYVLAYNAATGKLMAFEEADSAGGLGELDTAAALSAAEVVLLVICQ